MTESKGIKLLIPLLKQKSHLIESVREGVPTGAFFLSAKKIKKALDIIFEDLLYLVISSGAIRTLTKRGDSRSADIVI